MIVATASGAIWDIDDRNCTYRIFVSISSAVPAQPKIPLPAGVNVRTEYFLRQLYAQKNPGNLIIRWFGDQPIEKPTITFIRQNWAIPDFTDLEQFRKNLVDKDKSPSVVRVNAIFRLKDKKRLSGEGSASITMAGREPGVAATQPPADLSANRPDARMRSLLLKWAFSVRPAFRYIQFAQAGDPVVVQ
jgi:hypothetical protein